MAIYLCGLNKGSSDDRKDLDPKEENYNHDVDNLLIITTGLQNAATKLKKLQRKIWEKQKNVDRGLACPTLKSKQDSYSATLKELCIYVPQLQPIIDNTKDRTGPPNSRFGKSYLLNEKHKLANRGRGELESDRDWMSLKITQRADENLRLKKELEESENEKAALNINHKEEMGVLKNELRYLKESLRSAEAKINQLARQLEDERKDNEAALLGKSEEYMNEKSTLKHNYQEEIQNLQEEIQRLKERTKKQEQLQLHSASTEQKENDILKEECKRLIRTLEESENEKVALKVSHKEEIGAYKEEIRKLKERLTTDKSSYEKREKELKTKCDGLEADIASYKENWTKSEDQKIQLAITITELEKKSKEWESEIKKWKNQYNSLEDENRRTKEEIKRIKALNNQLRIQHENERKDKEDALLRLEAKNNQWTNQLDNEKKAKEDALLRLSSMASNKLRDNNPNIADLSDPNRPTKITEQFSELYENEWRYAFNELEKLLGDKNEKDIIFYLRDFVLEIHSVCSDMSSSKMKTVEEAFVKPSVQFRVLGHLEEKYIKDPVAGCLQLQNVKQYIDKCTEVCWYMSVQDPQMVIDGSKSPDKKFDSNKHREYTTKGPYEEFVVWPVLYLYRGGPMLSKGVAQGAKMEMIGQQ